ncbi:probable alpha-L-arabinofuranosidase A [Bradysia coprophila]|uniref:probable alpha-L-arabinofuranosidase A n=1 Tax=Bradysia coprophila TaxID=38358 RepID=UPI00187D7470|nr:probable alpha-L-arabinofuranosidase A [Bradysia coprophila]
MSTLALIVSLLISSAYSATLTVHVEHPAHEIGPELFGIFLEEINHALDGGLHAELIKNRGLNPRGTNNLEGYGAVTSGSAQASISISSDNPLNEVLNTSLRLQVNSRVTNGDRVGILNTGYWGIPIRPDYTFYNASFYAKSATNFNGPLTVTIESSDGSIIYASAVVPQISSTFQKYEVSLVPTAALIQSPTLDVVFVISIEATASAIIDEGTQIFFQLVSLYPPTWRNKPNGLRIDIAEKLAAARPSIMRFPGGSFIQGIKVGDEVIRYVWEETLGPIEERPGYIGTWGYYASNGVGMLEYLEFAEELNATAVICVYSGLANGAYSHPLEEIGEFVESALNAIEYAIGDTSSKWGSIRAANGHPNPFPLPYIEIGNEDYFSRTYNERYPLFYDAIRAKFPQITIIGSDYAESRPVPVRDDHYYVALGGFPQRHTLYDDWPRDGSKVYIGEYATRDGDYNYTGELVIPHLGAALEDASFLMSMERNADLIIMSSYAPLLSNVNDLRWTPNGIYFDGLSSYATPAWWVQHLFSTKRGNIYIPSDFDGTNATFFHSAVLDTVTNTIVIKAVNNGATAVSVDTDLMGICRTDGGKVTVLTGARFDSNSLQVPMKISPKESAFTTTTGGFTFNAPAYSLTIFEIKFTGDGSCSGGGNGPLTNYLLLMLLAVTSTTMLFYTTKM